MPDPGGLNIWWARNDGMSGHVWLSAEDVARLHDEMAAQGMGLEVAAGRISAAEIERALDDAEPEALLLGDAKLWRDWLTFLEGAAANGGLLVR
jgi:hypothetical protein